MVIAGFGEVTAAAPGAGESSLLPPVRRLVMDNGLRVLAQSDCSLPLIAVHASYAGGSRNDPPGREGLAHLAEHLALRGPEGRWTEAVEAAGGVVQGTTLHDQVTFSTLLPSRHLDVALELEALRLQQAADLSPRTVAAQQRVLVEELCQRADDGHDAPILESLHRCLYPPGHPYHAPPAGSPAGVLSTTAAELRAHVEDSYVPRRTTIAVVGDFDTDECLEVLAARLARLPNPPTGGPEPSRELPPPSAGASATVRGHRSPPSVWIGIPVPGIGEPGWFAAQLIAHHLAVGRGSLLHRRLVEARPLARRVTAGMAHMRDGSTLCLEATAAGGVALEELEEVLAGALDEWAESEPPSPQDLRPARAKAANDHYRRMQELPRRAAFLALHDRAEGVEPDVDLLPRGLAAIAPAALQRFAHARCRRACGVLLRIAPHGGPA
ncbi:MAG TPA: pitrilysin family protein [Thermoanaerobaculia bacterium]|nr:pitrilysin family protein [Thermoanaerobaculia bacterium]